MNANELADELEIAQGNNNSVELIPEAIAMLRILDGQLAFRIDAVTKYQAKVEEQQAEIENLKAGLLSHHDIYPVKELTDEEIDFIFFDLPSGHSIQEFARAILRKAQENG